MFTKPSEPPKAEEISVQTVNRLTGLMLAVYAFAILSYLVYCFVTP